MNPATNAMQTGTWQEIPDNTTSGSPTERHETAFVMAGGKFYLIAGREADDIDIFDPDTLTWSTGATIPTLNAVVQRMHHFQPIVIDGLIFVVAAYTGRCCVEEEVGATNVYIYDPLEDMWIVGADIPQNRRRGSTGVVRYQDTLYVAGGLQFGHGRDGSISYDFFDSYNPFTNEWAVLPSMPRSRDHFGAAIVGDKIYAAGGRDTGEGNGTTGVVISEVDVFDISDNQWTTLASTSNIPTARGGTATTVLDGNVVVIGGEEKNQALAFDETEALNTNTGQWITVDNLNNARHGTTATLCNGTIWIAGGSPERASGKMINIERYHPTAPTDCTEPEITASTLSASSGNFGNVTLSTSKTQTITINNMGGTQATFVAASALQNNTQNAFEIEDAPAEDIIIAANSSITIDVTFTSAAEGAATADLVLETPQKANDFVVSLTAFTPVDIDIDNNGIITPADAIYVINRVGGNDLSADVTGDGFVNGADVQAVINAIGQNFPPQ